MPPGTRSSPTPNSKLTLFGAEKVRSKPGTRFGPPTKAPRPSTGARHLGPSEVILLDAGLDARGVVDSPLRLLEVVSLASGQLPIDSIAGVKPSSMRGGQKHP